MQIPPYSAADCVRYVATDGGLRSSRGDKCFVIPKCVLHVGTHPADKGSVFFILSACVGCNSEDTQDGTAGCGITLSTTTEVCVPRSPRAAAELQFNTSRSYDGGSHEGSDDFVSSYRGPVRLWLSWASIGLGINLYGAPRPHRPHLRSVGHLLCRGCSP